MIRATRVLPAGHWTAATDCVVLDFDERYRRRVSMSGIGGLAFLLDLAEPVMLRGGDALALEDGRLVEVVAAPEALVEIRAGTPAALVRLAWHIGNRHLPAQIMPKAIRLRRDHVIEAMLAGLGAGVTPIEAPFDPEGGAYASGPEHQGHDHGAHGHDHHDHDPGDDHHDHGHDKHGHDKHDHDHDHHDHHPHRHSHT